MPLDWVKVYLGVKTRWQEMFVDVWQEGDAGDVSLSTIRDLKL